MGTHKGSIISNGSQRAVGIILSPLLGWRTKTQIGGAVSPRSPPKLMSEVGLLSLLLLGSVISLLKVGAQEQEPQDPRQVTKKGAASLRITKKRLFPKCKNYQTE